MPAGTTPTRALVEGALLAAVGAVLLLIVAYVPLGAYLVFVTPTPVAVAAVRHGLRLAALVGAVTALLVLAFLGPVPALLMGATVLGIGLPLGYGLRRRAPAARTIALTAVGFGAVVVLGIGIGLVLTGVNPLDEVLDLYERSGAASDELGRRLGLPPDVLERQRQAREAALALVRVVLPAGLAAGALLGAFLTYLAAGAVLRRLGHDVPELPPFAEWQLPAYVSWAFVGVQLASAAATRAGVQGLQRPLANVVYLFFVAFLVNGFATAYFFLRRWQLSRRAAAWILAIVALAGLAPVLLWLGWLEPPLRLRRWAAERDRERPAGRIDPKQAGEGAPAGGDSAQPEGER